MAPQVSPIASTSLNALGRGWLVPWRKPDRRRIYEWAHDYVVLPAGVYAEQGRFSVEISRYLIKPFDALQDDRVRVVTAQFPVRSGKTLLADIWLPWTLCNRPGPFMWNMNSETLARRHQRTRLLPVLMNIPQTAALLPLDPRQRTGEEIMFRNGVPFYIQAPSPLRLQGVGVQYLVEDELRQRSEGMHEEAVGRLGDYEKVGASKLLNIGQGGIEDDDADIEFKRGSQEEWMVPCLSCGKRFAPVTTGYRPDGTRYGLIWGNILPDGSNTAMDKSGRWIKARVMESVRYGCPACGYEHDCERAMKQWNLQGDYEVQNPTAPATHRSFHLYGTISRPWKLLADDLSEALNALKAGMIKRLEIFTQKYDALPWSEARLFDGTRGRTHEILTPDSTWEHEAFRVLAVDHQQAGVNWGLVAGVGNNGELRRYWFGKLIGDEDIEAKRIEWKVPAHYTVIDCAWDTKRVYSWCIRYGWSGLVGDPRKSFQWMVGKKSHPIRIQKAYSKFQAGDPGSGTVHDGRRFARFRHWSNPTIKDVFKSLQDRGRILEPINTNPEDPDEKEYRHQMKGQWRRFVKDRSGRGRFEWFDNGEDHARDCWNEVLVVAISEKRLPDIEKDPTESSPDGPQGEEEQARAE